MVDSAHEYAADVSAAIRAVACWWASADPPDPLTACRMPEWEPELYALFVKGKKVAYEAMVDDAVARRSRSLASQRPSSRLSTKGRLLRYNFGETTFFLASKEVSDGFFDTCDCPPWGLWCAYVTDTEFRYFSSMRRSGPGWLAHDEPKRVQYLLSWVPDTLLDPASAGIQVNAEECVSWLSDSDTVLSRGLLRDWN